MKSHSRHCGFPKATSSGGGLWWGCFLCVWNNLDKMELKEECGKARRPHDTPSVSSPCLTRRQRNCRLDHWIYFILLCCSQNNSYKANKVILEVIRTVQSAWKGMGDIHSQIPTCKAGCVIWLNSFGLFLRCLNWVSKTTFTFKFTKNKPFYISICQCLMFSVLCNVNIWK